MILSLSSAAALPPCFTSSKQQQQQQHSHLLLHRSQFRLRSSSKLCASLGSDSSNYEREEVRWIREEQRWLREEQRWLREEQRWLSERESLLREIADLKLKSEALERRSPSQQGTKGVAETIANLASMLQVLKEGEYKGRIADSGAGPSPIVLEAAVEREKEEIVVKEIRVVESRDVGEVKKVVKRKVLKQGAEGEEVKRLQEALQKLGFYSGEEDTEFSSFSSGTERAVKTWQSSVGAPEDGIMTSELLEWLYSEKSGDIPNFRQQAAIPEASFKDPTNGVAVASLTHISEVQQKVVTETGITEVDLSDRRVFLLGENRWEEPSRLTKKGNQSDESKKKSIASMCTLCNGQGRLLCMECDGTGEPNIEQQFLEWVDEEMKCPYCDGVGHTACDACDGKPF